MSKDAEARPHGLQPPLPLAVADGGTGHPAPPDPEVDWRLDERTREIGRRGIAAARARLRSSDGTGRRTTGRGPGAGPDAPGRAPGRAA